MTLGNVTIDRDRFEVWVGERRVSLTFVEFEILDELARNAGRVLSRPQLVTAIWGGSSDGGDRRLTVHISRLRKKMEGSAPWRLRTVTKRGYALVDDGPGASGAAFAQAVR